MDIISKQIPETGCCPKFDPAPWNGTSHQWDNKHFIRGRVRTLFYMPLNFGSVVRRLMGQAKQAGVGMPDWMGLSDHVSRWSMDLYVAVDGNVPGADNIALSGSYMSKVYEGNLRNTGRWMRDFQSYLAKQEKNPHHIYVWYTTCPKCAKTYGKNFVVIIAKV